MQNIFFRIHFYMQKCYFVFTWVPILKNLNKSENNVVKEFQNNYTFSLFHDENFSSMSGLK